MSCEYVLRNAAGMAVTINELGAAWTSCRVPEKSRAQKPREVLVFGADTKSALLESGSYAGAVVGRYAGRIAGGRYQHRGQTHQLTTNDGKNCLHGGKNSFAQRPWALQQARDNEIVATLYSHDGEDGFSGNLEIVIRYILKENNVLIMECLAKSDADTACNITNHAYFNLNGADSDDEEKSGLQQKLQIFSEYFQPVGADGIPNEIAQPVAGSSFDFRAGKMIATDFLGDHWQRLVGGYDHSFLLENQSTLRPAARLQSADEEITLTISTTQPAIHLYTGQYLNVMTDRRGTPCPPCAGIALETQAPPDSPNRHPNWGILPAGVQYRHVTQWAFS